MTIQPLQTYSSHIDRMTSDQEKKMATEEARASVQLEGPHAALDPATVRAAKRKADFILLPVLTLSLIHISEPTRQPMISRMPSSA